MLKHRLSPGPLIIFAFVVSLLSSCDGPGTLIPTDPAPPTRAPVTTTYTPTRTRTPAPSPTETATPAPTATPSVTPTPPPSATPTEPVTSEPSVTPVLTETIAPTATPRPTAAPAPTEAVRSAEVAIGGCPGGCTEPNPNCQIKGNINSKGEKIYHMPGQRYWEQTQIKPEDGERWFCTEEEAVAAGWRKSKQ